MLVLCQEGLVDPLVVGRAFQWQMRVRRGLLIHYENAFGSSEVGKYSVAGRKCLLEGTRAMHLE